MNELLQAAKAVIDRWDDPIVREDYWVFNDVIARLRAAVERAENPPTDYNEWTSKNSGRVLSAHEVWTDAQQAERERIRARAKLAAEKTFKAGGYYVGPQHYLIEQFVEALLGNDDE